MSDFILICLVAAQFIIGYFIVKKWDVFLENNGRQVSELPETSVLRIAFEVPAMAGLLERFSKKNPDCGILLFSGSAAEIEKKLAAKELDCAFLLSEQVNANEQKSISFSVKPESFTPNGIGLPVFPLEKEEYRVRIVWREAGSSREIDSFTEQLNHFLQKRQMTV